MAESQDIDRILFCSSFTPPVNAGGGKNAYNFAKFLSKKDFEVTLLSLNRKGKLKRRERTNGLKVVRILYFNYNLLTKILSLFIILPGYLYYILKNQVILIYGGNIIGYEFIILMGRVLKKKVIFQSLLLNDDDIKSLVERRSGGRIRKIILNQVSVYFSLNPVLSDGWRKTYGSGKRIYESAQGVDTSIFFKVRDIERSRLRQKLGLPKNKIILLSVGYIIERKGFREVFEILQKINSDFIYLIIGDYKLSDDHYMVHFNEEMRKLYEYGNYLLQEKVLFIGQKSNVDEYYKSADLFILNSKLEGFPNAILEAMACGLPCILNGFKGVANHIVKENENILVAHERDEINIFLKKLLNNPKLRKRLGESGEFTIRNEASFEIVWDQLRKYL